MARQYEHISSLAQEIRARRKGQALSFEKLGVLAGVDVAQTFRICRGEFRTLNPSVMKICKVLKIEPEGDGMVFRPVGDGTIEAMLSREVLTAWDRTDDGARLLVRVLRALHNNN